MIIQRKQFVGSLLPIACDDTHIGYTSKTKLLGVVIDSNLTWREQLEMAHNSFSSQYRVLKNCDTFLQNFLF